MLKLYNTLSKTIENFQPLKDKKVALYTCGPTVYDFAHIGNLRTYIFEDILHRVLEYNGYNVNHAMNITDVGHLVGDGDEGEDKLEVGAKREGKSPLEIAKLYTDKFFADMDELNIIRPNHILSATQSIPEQIEIIKILEEKGFAYKGEQAVYFDTSKFADYGKLSGQKLNEKKVGAREDVVVDKDKKHPADFALWFFLTGRYKNHILHWPSPWGEGFPGWHIECSAISRKLLGQPFDIHCGGVDHIGTHHTNEIAQSEAAFGAPLATIWMHGEFLLVNSSRMGKSEGNLLTLDELKKRGFSPLDYRYMCLQAHYRTQLNFTWETLEAARVARKHLYDADFFANELEGDLDTEAKNSFLSAINDDLNLPKALAIAMEVARNSLVPLPIKKTTLFEFDKILGLGIRENSKKLVYKFQSIAGTLVGIKEESLNGKNIEDLVTDYEKELIQKRKLAKDSKDYMEADKLRKELEVLKYEVVDTPQGQIVKKEIDFK